MPQRRKSPSWYPPAWFLVCYVLAVMFGLAATFKDEPLCSYFIRASFLALGLAPGRQLREIMFRIARPILYDNDQK